MTIPQIISIAAVICLLGLYLIPLIKVPTQPAPESLLSHLRNVIAVRDQYKTPPVTQACNALIQTLLEIK